MLANRQSRRKLLGFVDGSKDDLVADVRLSDGCYIVMMEGNKCGLANDVLCKSSVAWKCALWSYVRCVVSGVFVVVLLLVY